VAAAASGWALAASSYLIALAVAGARARRAPSPPPGHALNLTVLVPAHDEAGSIRSAVGGLLGCDYPADRLRVIVVADNCSDETAVLAREAGAESWERDDPSDPGKGQALAWALGRLRDEGAVTDAVVIFDADCVPSPNLLERLSARLAAGADGVQARLMIADPDASPAAALRSGAYTLMNYTRPLGKEALGLSVGLQGTGMALAARTLSDVPWGSFSLMEDREYHLQMVEAGLRVRFAADAEVRTPAPPSRAGANTQETRWDTGNLQLARTWLPRMLRDSEADSRQRLHTAIELIVPPQSALSALWATGLLTGVIARAAGLRRLALAAAVAQATYVVAGLWLARAPREVWRALLTAPLFVARRIGQIARIVARPPQDWERTERPGQRI
jgi:cellulose synthase/poly-beta-1,6-N-acetylglucosamine synthase-like glycosyltransferase